MKPSSQIIASRRTGASNTKTAQRAAGMMQGCHYCWCQKHHSAAPGRRV